MDTYPLVRKCLAVGIILLFVGTGVIPSIAQDAEKPFLPTSSDHWLYVGGSGPGNYTRIQDAIDDASYGDSVYVYRGTYIELIPTDYYVCVYINKSINLIGEDKYNTIIDGSNKYAMIRIESSHQVHITGFTLRNGGWNLTSPPLAGVGVIYSDDVLVDDNIITENRVGIDIRASTNISYFNNVISNNYIGGTIDDDRTKDCLIRNNFFLNNTYGIIMSMGLSIIEYNEFKGNELGISPYDSQFIIRYNNFIDNQVNVKSDASLSLTEYIEFLFDIHKWVSNYWDDWNKSTPKPILGAASIYIILNFPGWNPMILPFGIYPIIQFDWHPAQEPYDIPG